MSKLMRNYPNPKIYHNYALPANNIISFALKLLHARILSPLNAKPSDYLYLFPVCIFSYQKHHEVNEKTRQFLRTKCIQAIGGWLCSTQTQIKSHFILKWHKHDALQWVDCIAATWRIREN